MSEAQTFMISIAASPWQMWATLAIILTTIVCYSFDRLSHELVSTVSLVALLLLFSLAPIPGATGKETLAPELLLHGFASPALVAIMSLLIIGQGMFLSGAFELPTKQLLKLQETRPALGVAIVLALAMILSAFLNNTPVVVFFIPVLAAMAAQAKIPPSRVMMPLSYLAIFGGMTTIIGSSTNILVGHSYAASVEDARLGFFDLAPMGLLLGAIGVAYMAAFGRQLLPARAAAEALAADREGKQFIAQIEISRTNPLIGKSPVAGLFPDLPDITVRMVQRREEAILPPFDDLTFKQGDILIVAATRQALTNLLKKRPAILDGVITEINLVDEENVGARAHLNIVEAIVAPGARVIGRTIGEIGFHAETNCVILGVERRSRMLRVQLSTIPLEAGDVLLILGDLKDVRALRADRDIVLLERSMEGLPDVRNARLSTLIFAAVVLAAASGVFPIEVATIAGAAAMVVFGCLTTAQAARAFDRRLYLLIGASLAMGAALQETGAARLIGEGLAFATAGLGPTALISAMFIICAGLANIFSNNAAAVLLTPIAVSAAQKAGLDPYVLILTVIYGASCAFATPIAHQTNLLTMTPGRYNYRDYLKVGGPLILLLWIAYSALAPMFFSAIGKL